MSDSPYTPRKEYFPVVVSDPQALTAEQMAELEKALEGHKPEGYGDGGYGLEA